MFFLLWSCSSLRSTRKSDMKKNLLNEIQIANSWFETRSEPQPRLEKHCPAISNPSSMIFSNNHDANKLSKKTRPAVLKTMNKNISSSAKTGALGNQKWKKPCSTNYKSFTHVFSKHNPSMNRRWNKPCPAIANPSNNYFSNKHEPNKPSKKTSPANWKSMSNNFFSSFLGEKNPVEPANQPTDQHRPHPPSRHDQSNTRRKATQRRTNAPPTGVNKIKHFESLTLPCLLLLCLHSLFRDAKRRPAVHPRRSSRATGELRVSGVLVPSLRPSLTNFRNKHGTF